jgi:hypothetical protein
LASPEPLPFVFSRGWPVLRLARPGDKCLGRALEPLPATQELGEGRRGETAHRDEGKEGKNRLALPHVHLGNLPDEARVPTKGSALLLSRVTVGEKEGELECFRQPDDLEFGGCGERLGDVPTVERSAETHIG